MYFQTAEWENTNQRDRIEGLGLSKAKPGLPDVSGPRLPHRRGSRVHVEKAPDWQTQGTLYRTQWGPRRSRARCWMDWGWLDGTRRLQQDPFSTSHSIYLSPQLNTSIFPSREYVLRWALAVPRELRWTAGPKGKQTQTPGNAGEKSKVKSNRGEKTGIETPRLQGGTQQGRDLRQWKGWGRLGKRLTSSVKNRGASGERTERGRSSRGKHEPSFSLTWAWIHNRPTVWRKRWAMYKDRARTQRCLSQRPQTEGLSKYLLTFILPTDFILAQRDGPVLLSQYLRLNMWPESKYFQGNFLVLSNLW